MKRALNWEIQRQNAILQRDLLLAKFCAAKIPFILQHENVMVKVEELTPAQEILVDKIISDFVNERKQES